MAAMAAISLLVGQRADGWGTHRGLQADLRGTTAEPVSGLVSEERNREEDGFILPGSISLAASM